MLLIDLAMPTLITRLGSQSSTFRRIIWNWLASWKALKNTLEWRDASRMHPSDPQVKDKTRDKSSVCSAIFIRQRSPSTREACSESSLLDASVRVASDIAITLVLLTWSLIEPCSPLRNLRRHSIKPATARSSPSVVEEAPLTGAFLKLLLITWIPWQMNPWVGEP